MSSECEGDRHRAALPVGAVKGKLVRANRMPVGRPARGRTAEPASYNLTETWRGKPQRKVESERRKTMAFEHAAYVARMTGGAPPQGLRVTPEIARSLSRTSVGWAASVTGQAATRRARRRRKGKPGQPVSPAGMHGPIASPLGGARSTSSDGQAAMTRLAARLVRAPYRVNRATTADRGNSRQRYLDWLLGMPVAFRANIS